MEYGEYKKVPNALKEYRIRKGLTQKQVASFLGLKDRAWISRWESGYVLPSLLNAARLSLLYETPLESLFHSLLDTVKDDRI
jgi:transcriptional regulator with XRE-family HTH domain